MQCHFLFIVVFLSICAFGHEMMDGSVEYFIRHRWDGRMVEHDPVRVTLTRLNNTHISVRVHAPYFRGKAALNDETTESVQFFFLGQDNWMLSLEINPHNQYRTQLLSGTQLLQDSLPLDYMSQIHSKTWAGEAFIPEVYLPPGVSRFQVFAVHPIVSELDADIRQYDSRARQINANFTCDVLFPGYLRDVDTPEWVMSRPNLESFEHLPASIAKEMVSSPSPIWRLAMEFKTSSSSTVQKTPILMFASLVIFILKTSKCNT